MYLLLNATFDWRSMASASCLFDRGEKWEIIVRTNESSLGSLACAKANLHFKEVRRVANQNAVATGRTLQRLEGPLLLLWRTSQCLTNHSLIAFVTWPRTNKRFLHLRIQWCFFLPSCAFCRYTRTESAKRVHIKKSNTHRSIWCDIIQLYLFRNSV